MSSDASSLMTSMTSSRVTIPLSLPPGSVTGTEGRLYVSASCATSSWSTSVVTDRTSRYMKSASDFSPGADTICWIETTPQSRSSESVT